MNTITYLKVKPVQVRFYASDCFGWTKADESRGVFSRGQVPYFFGIGPGICPVDYAAVPEVMFAALESSAGLVIPLPLIRVLWRHRNMIPPYRRLKWRSAKFHS